MKDFDFELISKTFNDYGVSLNDLEAIAVAVFDHGNAPAGVSDRQFRFDYLDERIRAKNSLSAFAYLSTDIPKIMTRLQSVADSAGKLPCPLVVMDTAPAAVLGANFDPSSLHASRRSFAMWGISIHWHFVWEKRELRESLNITQVKLICRNWNHLLRALADSSLKHEDVFNDMGHGALMYSQDKFEFGKDDFDVVVTGPRRSMFNRSICQAESHEHRPYVPISHPFGDMMIAGCFGLLAATAEIMPKFSGDNSRVVERRARARELLRGIMRHHKGVEYESAFTFDHFRCERF